MKFKINISGYSDWKENAAAKEFTQIISICNEHEISPKMFLEFIQTLCQSILMTKGVNLKDAQSIVPDAAVTRSDIPVQETKGRSQDSDCSQLTVDYINSNELFQPSQFTSRPSKDIAETAARRGWSKFKNDKTKIKTYPKAREIILPSPGISFLSTPARDVHGDSILQSATSSSNSGRPSVAPLTERSDLAGLVPIQTDSTSHAQPQPPTTDINKLVTEDNFQEAPDSSVSQNARPHREIDPNPPPANTETTPGTVSVNDKVEQVVPRLASKRPILKGSIGTNQYDPGAVYQDCCSVVDQLESCYSFLSTSENGKSLKAEIDRFLREHLVPEIIDFTSCKRVTELFVGYTSRIVTTNDNRVTYLIEYAPGMQYLLHSFIKMTITEFKVDLNSNQLLEGVAITMKASIIFFLIVLISKSSPNLFRFVHACMVKAFPPLVGYHNNYRDGDDFNNMFDFCLSMPSDASSNTSGSYKSERSLKMREQMLCFRLCSKVYSFFAGAFYHYPSLVTNMAADSVSLFSTDVVSKIVSEIVKQDFPLGCCNIMLLYDLLCVYGDSSEMKNAPNDENIFSTAINELRNKKHFLNKPFANSRAHRDVIMGFSLRKWAEEYQRFRAICGKLKARLVN